MKNKIITLLFCLFTLFSFAQKKIVNKQKQAITTVQKSTICNLCKGTGKDPVCKGTGICQNHNLGKFLDSDCYRNCKCDDGDEDNEPETKEECSIRCKKYCEQTTACNNCDSYDGTCKKMWCNNGVCRNCNGKGKVIK